MGNLSQLEKVAEGLSPSPKMPVFFLGHGSPMNAISTNEFTESFRKIGNSLDNVQLILCISAHWLTRGTWVTANETQRTIHDFGGFPQALYKVEYPAPGSPAWAKTIAELQPQTIHEDLSWGLDHGAWSVLVHLFPEAKIPVIQMSIDYTQSSTWHYQLASMLRDLRSRGVLIIGSGNMVHNLAMADFNGIDKIGYGYDWAFEAQHTLNDWLNKRNDQAMLAFESGSKALRLAAPTTDHFLPLIYTLGLKEKDEELEIFNDSLLAGSLSMTSVRFGKI
jgi:4,5-DOPA dioxygenase extradiol